MLWRIVVYFYQLHTVQQYTRRRQLNVHCASLRINLKHCIFWWHIKATRSVMYSECKWLVRYIFIDKTLCYVKMTTWQKKYNFLSLSRNQNFSTQTQVSSCAVFWPLYSIRLTTLPHRTGWSHCWLINIRIGRYCVSLQWWMIGYRDPDWSFAIFIF